MEQSPSNRVSFHVRMVNLMALLFIIDCVLAQHAINITLTKGPNMMVMFGFEVKIYLLVFFLRKLGKEKEGVEGIIKKLTPNYFI